MVSEDAHVPVASLSMNAAQIASAKSQRAPTPSADDSHGVVPAAGTCAWSVVPLSQAIISTARTRALSDVPLGHGLSSATGTRASSAVPLSRGIN